MFEKIKNHEHWLGFKERHPHIHVAMVIVAIIMFWRGVWGLLDVFLFPQHPTLSYFVSVVVGVFILYIDGFSLKDLKR